MFLGLVTLSGFLYFWGWVFVVTTSLVAVIKKEVDYQRLDQDTRVSQGPVENVKNAYFQLWKILQLKPIRTLVVILFTCKVCNLT